MTIILVCAYIMCWCLAFGSMHVVVTDEADGLRRGERLLVILLLATLIAPFVPALLLVRFGRSLV
jgi:Na+-translocating ferredoxin:NAD+ oxidoreductase RnfD subunit